MFAFYGNPIAIDESGTSDDLIVSHVYEAFKLIFTPAAASSSSSTTASESDESFSKQGKLLSFVRALLKAGKLACVYACVLVLVLVLFPYSKSTSTQ